MTFSTNKDKLSATHSPPSEHSADAAMVCDTPSPTRSALTTTQAQCADDCVGNTISTTTTGPHCVRGGDSGACDAQRFLFLRASIPHHLMLCRRSRVCRVWALTVRSACSPRALIPIVLSQFFRYPALIFRLLFAFFVTQVENQCGPRLPWIALCVLANTSRWAQKSSQTMTRIRFMMEHVLCRETGEI